METRVAILERRVDEIASGVSALQTGVAAVQVSLAKLPTKQDLNNTFLASLALGFAVMAIVIGGIIGGLGWLRTDAPPAVAASSPALQPIIIQLPPAPSASTR